MSIYTVSVFDTDLSQYHEAKKTLGKKGLLSVRYEGHFLNITYVLRGDRCIVKTQIYNNNKVK